MKTGDVGGSEPLLNLRAYICQDAQFARECNDTPWVAGMWIGNDGKCMKASTYGSFSREAVEEADEVITKMMEET
jgi:hypothetical protein